MSFGIFKKLKDAFKKVGGFIKKLFKGDKEASDKASEIIDKGKKYISYVPQALDTISPFVGGNPKVQKVIDKTKQISQGIGKGLGYLDDVIDLNQTFRGSKGWGTQSMKPERSSDLSLKGEMKRTEDEIEEAEDEDLAQINANLQNINTNNSVSYGGRTFIPKFK